MLGPAPVVVVAVVVVVAGLEALGAVAAGLEAVVVVVVAAAGVEAAGTFGAADGVCASASGATAQRTISGFRNVFMRRFWRARLPGVKLKKPKGSDLRGGGNSKPFSSKRRGDSASGP